MRRWRLLIVGLLSLSAAADFDQNSFDGNSFDSTSFLLGEGIASVATLDFDFVTDKSITPRTGPTFTYTRADEGSYYNSTGVFKVAAANTPLFDHKPSTNRSRGLYMSEERTNLVIRSNEMANAAWTGSNATLTGSAGIAPDGTNSFARLDVTPGSSAHFAYSTVFTTVSASNYVASVYLKDDGARYAGISLTEAAENHISILADLQEGKIVAKDVGATSGTILTTSIEDVGNDIFRLAFGGSSTGAGTMFLYVYTSDTDLPTFNSTGQVVHNPSDGDDVLMWGAQVELAQGRPSPLIPTTTIAKTQNTGSLSTTDVSWYNSSGTLFIEYEFPLNIVSSRALVEISDNSTANRHLIYVPTGTDDVQGFISATTTQAQLTSTTIAYGRPTRTALSFGTNDVEMYTDGVRVGTGDQLATMPAGISKMTIGSVYDGAGSPAHTRIRRVQFYSDKFSTADLATLTTWPNTGLVVGDSFSDAVNEWVYLIDERAANLAVGGDQLVDDIEPTFAADMAAAEDTTTFVVLSGGVNDIITGDTLANMQTAMTSMITTARAANVRVFVLGIGPWKNYTSWSAGNQTITDNYNAWLAAQASIQGFTYLDMYSALEGPADELRAVYDSGDGIHPNYEGAHVIARVFELAYAQSSGGAYRVLDRRRRRSVN